MNIVGEEDGRGWTELSSLLPPSATTSTMPHHTATEEWGKKSGCVSLPIVSCFSKQSPMTKRKKKTPSEPRSPLGFNSIIPLPGSLPHILYFFGLVRPPLPSSCPARAAEQGQQAEGWDDEFRNAESAGRLGFQPRKHFPAEEEISRKR